MYSLHIDKQETFRCSIKISGASLTQAVVRLSLESEFVNMYFNGSVVNNEAVIPIKPLKRFLNVGDTGVLKLEVIVDNTYIIPWQSTFIADTAIKVFTNTPTSETSSAPIPRIELDSVKIAELVNRIKDK